MPHNIKKEKKKIRKEKKIKKKRKKQKTPSLPLKGMLEEILKSGSKEVSGARDEKIPKTLLKCLLS